MKASTNDTVQPEPKDWDAPIEVVNALDRMRVPIIVAHVVPDADALGSMFALANAYASDHCRPRVALPDGSLSQKLAFLLEYFLDALVESTVNDGRFDPRIAAQYLIINLIKEDVKKVITTVLSYKKPEKHNVPDPDIIAAALISA